jgi:hypothetical protein
VSCHAYSTITETRELEFLTEIKLPFQAVVKATQLQSFCHTKAMKPTRKILEVAAQRLYVLLIFILPYKTAFYFQSFEFEIQIK